MSLRSFLFNIYPGLVMILVMEEVPIVVTTTMVDMNQGEEVPLRGSVVYLTWEIHVL